MKVHQILYRSVCTFSWLPPIVANLGNGLHWLPYFLGSLKVEIGSGWYIDDMQETIEIHEDFLN